MKKKRIYCDWASATPVDVRVARAVGDALIEYPGNPSSSHEEARRAKNAIDEARRRIAETLSVKPEELVFTSGGTESNNIAIRGFIEALRLRGVSYRDMHIVTSSIEHSSVLETLEKLVREGVMVTKVNPEPDGILDPKKVASALTKKTVLVTLAHVNSEVGTIQPLASVADEIKKWRALNTSMHSATAPETKFPVLHADCAQSPLYLESGAHSLRVDLASYDAQKVMGPKGVGILYRNFSVPIVSLYGGGTQERNVRPGTENAAGIIGASVAFVAAAKGRYTRAKNVSALRDYLVKKIETAVPDAVFMGNRKKRIPNNAFFSVAGIDGDYLTVLMDSHGVATSPRSACAGSGGKYSHVIFSMTGNRALATGTIRFSLGPGMTKKDMDAVARAFSKSVQTARS